jgi:methionine biosynthesis protein MetW
MSDTHQRTIDWVPRGARVLELGCACGDLGALLQRDKDCSVLGVEVDDEAAAEARGRGLEVLGASLEDPATLDVLAARGPFDVVIATDVLEHLRDPQPVVAALVRFVSPRGLAIVAVPNVATWSSRWRLLTRGTWEYGEDGLLDRTHLRFFTWDTIHRLVEQHGWRVTDRVIDGYEIPGASVLLGRVPEALRARVTHWPATPPGLRRELLLHSNLVLDSVIRARQRLHRALLARVPNLVAPHLGLLLRRAQPS